MHKHIKVTYKVYSTDYNIKKVLKGQEQNKVLSFDLETNAVFSKSERALAKKIINSKDFSGKTELEALENEDLLDRKL